MRTVSKNHFYIDFILWCALGALMWLFLGGLTVYWSKTQKLEARDKSEVAIALSCKVLCCLTVVALCVKYGFLGPLIGAIVHAIKNA